ncbi:translation initiation factor eIF-2B subunit alpha, variant 2 [Entomophthora muscae]|uniref:Translation initiation factor eIF-2B subunit alpha, variant 2 n=1 Tax=Entomophthora muscae TaxID=34485 RepID=A0ACC2U251_9FUNG|nr:translation initiation factor eIF-2B subunit alpha, variant 2 [Entomophthora muscae]
MNEKFAILDRLLFVLKSELEFAIPVAAIKVLTEAIDQDNASTMSELMATLDEAIKKLKSASFCSPVPIAAGCDLFQRFVTRSSPDFTDFSAFKSHIITRGQQFVSKAGSCRSLISNLAVQFIQDNKVVLIHSFSRVVMSALQLALTLNKQFRVYVTESRPSSSGLQAVKTLQDSGVHATLIMDGAVGYIMDQVDLVLVGAEGVVENGGLINQIGTYQIAMIAKACNVPLYCLAESFKFVRLFPLNQKDLPINTPLIMPYISIPDIKGSPPTHTLPDKEQLCSSLMVENPSLDYTPPNYITLLVTDLGVLTPSGVSDELVKLYF